MGGGDQALRVHVIGTFRAEGFTEQQIGSRKARTALRLLAIAGGRPVSTDRIIDVLWPDEQPRDPAGQLAVIVSRLRRVLGAERIVHSDAGYTFKVDWVDLEAATALVTEAERRLAASNPAAALAAATSARALLSHPALDDDVWLEPERRGVARLAARARQLVARIALASGDLATGVEAAEQAIDADPYDEEALRLAMAGLAAQGRTSSALALHERVRAQLADELGTSPSEDTDAVHRAVLKGLPIAGIDVAVHKRRIVVTGSDAIFGREDELRALDALFTEVRAGMPQIAVIEGEPGIGKSALVAAWISGLDAETTVLETRCDQLSRMLPMQPVLHMIRLFLRRAGASDARDLLGGDAELLEPVLDWHGTTSAPDHDTAQTLASSPAGIAMLFAALGRVVTRACISPSVLFIDDFQRADSLTSDWIAELAHTELPLLILVTRRSGEGGMAAAAHRIELTPLSIESTVQMVGRERATELHRRSAGNPLFLSALARSSPGSALPESIQSAVAARCAEAPQHAGTIRDAAVLGSSVDVDVVARALKMEPIPLLGALETGISLHLLEERDGSYVFRHEIVREALEASVGSPRRALLHRNAARILSAQSDADPMLIAHHARLSGARNIASRALTSASQIATERFDYAAALGFADEAIAAMDTTAARLQRATVLLRMARYPEAQRDAEVAVSNGDELRAYEVAGAVAYYCRDFGRALTLGMALLEDARTPEQGAQAHVIQARALHAEGNVAAADEQMTAALQACTAHRLRRPTAVYAWLKVHMGEPEKAIAAIESSSFGTDQTLSTIYTSVHAHFIRGYALATVGRAGDALRVLERATAEARRRGLKRYESLGVNMSSWVRRNIGDTARARECNAVASEEARAADYRELEVYAVVDPCEDDIAAGDIAAASVRLDAARELMRQPYAYAWRQRIRVRLLEGRIALRRGDPSAALENADSVISDAISRCAPRYARLGEVLELQARADLGAKPPESDALHRLSDALGGIAGLEAWWLLAELGSACGSSLCFDLAEHHRDRLAASLEPDARAMFIDYAGGRLERISTRTMSA